MKNTNDVALHKLRQQIYRVMNKMLPLSFESDIKQKITSLNLFATYIWSQIWMKTTYGNHILTARL